MLFSAFIEMVYRLLVNMFSGFVFIFDTVFSIQLFADFTLGEVALMLLVFSLTIELFSQFVSKEE